MFDLEGLRPLWATFEFEFLGVFEILVEPLEDQLEEQMKMTPKVTRVLKPLLLMFYF
jgi:hypothetical protein